MSLDDAIATGAVAEVLELAREVGGGAAFAVLGPDGRVVVGAPPAGEATSVRSHPVVVAGRLAGTVVADAGAPAALLALLARTLELAIDTAAAVAARTRIADELAIGRRIQGSLIPRHLPEVPGWSFAAAYEAAREVGGDMYDVFPLRNRPHLFGLLVADVTGKGIPAALLMADARALLHSAADNADGPADALRRVNRILVRERGTSLFVSAVLAIADARTGALRYASAGHEPPIRIRAGDGCAIDELEAGGPVLGAFDAPAFEERRAVLEPGDSIVLYTDGITETRDVAGSFLGEARLFDALRAACGRTAAEQADAVMAMVRAFRGDAEPFDDLTLVVAERAGPSA